MEGSAGTLKRAPLVEFPIAIRVVVDLVGLAVTINIGIGETIVVRVDPVLGPIIDPVIV